MIFQILLEDIQSSLGGVNNDLVKKLKEQIEELKAVFLTIEVNLNLSIFFIIKIYFSEPQSTEHTVNEVNIFK